MCYLIDNWPLINLSVVFAPLPRGAVGDFGVCGSDIFYLKSLVTDLKSHS